MQKNNMGSLRILQNLQDQKAGSVTDPVANTEKMLTTERRNNGSYWKEFAAVPGRYRHRSLRKEGEEPFIQKKM